MAKGFRNYNFEFDKNERRYLQALCKQLIKQVGGDQQYYHIERAFTSVQAKLNTPDETVKLTKDEFQKIQEQLSANVRHFKKKIEKASFLTKWYYKMMLGQFESMYNNHFKD
jgi:bisphosphoglycerate-dependent phosphoglycerate mutase